MPNTLIPSIGINQPGSGGALDSADSTRLHNLERRSNSAKDKDRLLEVSREFESLFLNMMLKEMRDTVPKYDPLHSYAQETYQEMLDREWTQNMVQHRSIGLADMMYRQLSRLESPRGQ